VPTKQEAGLPPRSQIRRFGGEINLCVCRSSNSGSSSQRSSHYIDYAIMAPVECTHCYYSTPWSCTFFRSPPFFRRDRSLLYPPYEQYCGTHSQYWRSSGEQKRGNVLI